MKKLVMIFALLIAMSGISVAQTADELLNNAKTQAQTEGKNILVIFHASWCGWCKKFEQGLDSSLVKPFFDANYVTLHLDVLENEKNKHLEVVNGEKYLNEFGGKDSGLPFWTILDANGKLIANSIVEGQNLGCPATETEVSSFIAILNKTTKNTKLEEQKTRAVFVLKD